ncbi:hypothetical protein, partial [Mycobacterium tuberculosis]
MGELKLFTNWLFAVLLLILLIGTLAASPSRVEASSKGEPSFISEWQMLWEEPGQSLSIEDISKPSDNHGWFDVIAGRDFFDLPEDVNSAWIKFQLPQLS